MTGHSEGIFLKEKMKNNEEGGCHQKSNRVVREDRMRMPPHHRKLPDDPSEEGRKMLELLGNTFDHDSYLGETIQDFGTMGRGGD